MNIKAAWSALWKKSTPLYRSMGGYAVRDGQVVWVADNFEKYYVDGYAANDLVYSIGHITSEKIKVAPWAPYKVKDESSLKAFERELKKAGRKDFNFKRCLDLQTKALELYTGDGRLNELLKWPNEQGSFSDLVANSSVDKMMTGNRYIRASLLDGGANGGKPVELEQLPPQCMNLVVSKTFPLRVLGYQLTSGQIIPIDKAEVMHDKYYNPLYDMQGSHFIGLSPLRAARYTLTNENSALEASTKSFQNMGPPGFIYVDDDRLSGEQALEQVGALKQSFYENHGGPSNANKWALSGYKTGATMLGLSPTDLRIIEQQKWNLVRFCNVWNFPHPLLLPDHLTDNNYEASEQALTSRCALPLMTSFRENFIRKLQTDWGYKGTRIVVDFDLSVYGELQQDKKEIAEWTSKVPMTIRQIYEALQIELPEHYNNDPMVDKIFTPNGKTLLDDLDPANIDRAMQEVDNGLNEEE